MSEKEYIKETRDDVKKILNVLCPLKGIGLSAKVSILWRTSIFIVCGFVLAGIKIICRFYKG